MKNLYVYIIVIMIVALQSCKEEVPKAIVLDKNNVMEVNVRHSAGDKWSSTDNFLPLPFNVAKGGEDDIIVLSERIKKGQTLEVKPIGAIRILQNDTLITYIVTIPFGQKHQSISVSDFDEFSTVFSGAKWIIEQYLLNRRNSYNVKLKSWENEHFAIKYLLK